MSRSTPESVVLELVECINSGDLDGIAALTAPKYTFTDMAGDIYIFEGTEAVKESWKEYLSAYPDYTILTQHVLRSGDGVAIVGRTTGSHLPPAVEREETVLWTAELEDGLVSEWRIYSTFMREDT